MRIPKGLLTYLFTLIILPSAAIVSIYTLIAKYTNYINSNESIYLGSSHKYIVRGNYECNVTELMSSIDDSLRSDVKISDVFLVNNSESCDKQNVSKYLYKTLDACKYVSYRTNCGVNPTLKPYTDELMRLRNRAKNNANQPNKLFEKYKHDTKFEYLVIGKNSIRKLKPRVKVNIDQFISACQVEYLTRAFLDNGAQDCCVSSQDCFAVHGNQNSSKTGWNIVKTVDNTHNVVFKHLSNKSVAFLDVRSCNKAVTTTRQKVLRKFLIERKDWRKSEDFMDKRDRFIKSSNELLHLKPVTKCVSYQRRRYLGKGDVGWRVNVLYKSIKYRILPLSVSGMFVPKTRLINPSSDDESEGYFGNGMPVEYQERATSCPFKMRYSYLINSYDRTSIGKVIKMQIPCIVMRDYERLLAYAGMYHNTYSLCDVSFKVTSDDLLRAVDDAAKNLCDQCSDNYESVNDYVRSKIDGINGNDITDLYSVCQKQYKFIDWLINPQNGDVVIPRFIKAFVISDTPLLAKSFLYAFANGNFKYADVYAAGVREHTCEYIYFYLSKDKKVLYLSSDGISVKQDGNTFVVSL